MGPALSCDNHESNLDIIYLDIVIVLDKNKENNICENLEIFYGIFSRHCTNDGLYVQIGTMD